jgi:pimeloyl-ACP methyl ester carboxylesterase
MPENAEPDVLLEHLAKAQEAMRDRLDLTGVVASFGGPVLVCVGDQDELVSVEESRELASKALEGRLEVFEGAGHFPSLEQPARFNEVLLEFLERWRS